jgi:transcriptional regulator GlxA family with amidase domain
MSELASLASLARFANAEAYPLLRIGLINGGAADGLSWASLRHPLRLAQKLTERCELHCLSMPTLMARLAASAPGQGGSAISANTPSAPDFSTSASASISAYTNAGSSLAAAVPTLPAFDLVLLVADNELQPQLFARLLPWLQSIPVWGGVGAPVLWLARTGVLANVRVALPWGLVAEVDAVAERAILTSNLYECDADRVTCAGSAASLDFALALVEVLFGKTVQAQIQEMLCVDRIRAGTERQRIALQARFGLLQPKLSEAVTLMEANLEEPLSTDEIAALVGVSRRQLERLFKQHLDNLPSRYYLELRLKRARQLLLDSHHSIVQIGLMCGFSSGSHFSTAFGVLFGITPREERQRRLQNGPNFAQAGEK